MAIPDNVFPYINIAIVAIYLLMIYLGYKRGFLFELLTILYTLASLLVSWFSAPVFASLFPLFDLGKVDDKYEILSKIYDINGLLNSIAYFLIIFLILKLVYSLLSLLVKSLNKIPVIGGFNQLLGGIFGVFNGTIIVLVLSLLLSLPVVSNGKAVKEKTFLKYIDTYSDEALSYIVDLYSDSSLKDGIDGMDVDEYRQEFKEWLLSFNKQ